MTDKRERNKSILTRMTKDELIVYQKKVKKSKLNQQEYNFKCLFEKDIIVMDGILELAMQIRKVGVNVNQIAKDCNTKASVNNSDIEKVKEMVADCWKLINGFVKESNNK